MRNLFFTALVAATWIITSTASAAPLDDYKAAGGKNAEILDFLANPYAGGLELMLSGCDAAHGAGSKKATVCQDAVKAAVASLRPGKPSKPVAADPCKANPCGEHGVCTASADKKSFTCECKDLWSGDKCQDAPIDCAAPCVGKVKKGEEKSCKVWVAYTQECMDPSLATVAENLCPADAPEALVDGNKVCQCSSDPSCILKKGDGKTCPWLLAWIKAHWWMLLIGIAALVTGLLFLIGYYRGRKSEVKCAKGCINKATGKPSMGKPGTKCSICGEVFPEPPKPPPAAPGSQAPKADEKGKALAPASVDKIVDERVKMSEEVLLLGLIEKLYNACDKGIVALEQELPVLKDPAQMAAKIDPVLVKAITHQVLRELHKQFGLLQQPDVKK